MPRLLWQQRISPHCLHLRESLLSRLLCCLLLPLRSRSCSGSFPSSTSSSRPCSTTSPGSRWPSFTSELDSLKTCCSSDCVPSKAVCYRPASRCWHAPRSTGQLLLLPPPLLSVTCCRWRCARSEERR